LQTLLQHRGATVWAPWTLLRAVFEAGFWALWILEPVKGRERRLRGLRAEVLDWKQRLLFFELFNIDTDPQVAAGYHRDADALNEPWSNVTARVDITRELRTMATVKRVEPDSPAEHLAAVWRGLSGLQHGYAYASLATSDATRSVPVAGGRVELLSVSDDAFEAFATSACWLLYEAGMLYVRRSTRTGRESPAVRSAGPPSRRRRRAWEAGGPGRSSPQTYDRSSWRTKNQVPG
jgi:hypothetical protein